MTDPIITCNEAIAFEESYFQNSEQTEWQAMQQAGTQVGETILSDFYEICAKPFSQPIHILVAVGKGHNGGDALIATQHIISKDPTSSVSYDLLISCAEKDLKENTKRALALLIQAREPRFQYHLQKETEAETIRKFEQTIRETHYDISIDGLLGMQFKPPIRGTMYTIIEWINNHPSIEMRTSVDLPSGVGDQSDSLPLTSDFTYATGILKWPCILKENLKYTGRIRYLDLGFFKDKPIEGYINHKPFSVVKDDILKPLRKFRTVESEKRAHGKLALLGGSCGMPGAIMMASTSALLSGCGLIKTYLPQSISPHFVTQWPEIMVSSFQTDQDGLLCSPSNSLFDDIHSFANTLVVGPGLGRSKNVTDILLDLLPKLDIPIVLDADALVPELLDSRLTKKWKSPAVVITPHLGEFKRLLHNNANFENYSNQWDDLFCEYCKKHNLIGVLKGPQSRICDGKQFWINPTGGPILARGGSGDLLAGLVGSCIAQSVDRSPFESTAMAVYWHGKAADLLAKDKGSIALRTTDITNYYHKALRN